jgi:hypothetical protein
MSHSAFAKGQELWLIASCYLPIALLHFLMPCVLAATLAELFELQPTRGLLFVLGGRVIPLFAITAL